MDIHFIDVLRSIVAPVAGAAIGYSFGLLQNAAQRHHQQLAQSGKLTRIWSLIPGAGGRVACLLIALVLVQLVCPLLFVGGTEWLVSGGLIAGYGLTLFTQLRLRIRNAA